MKSYDYEIPYHGGMSELVSSWIIRYIQKLIKNDKRIKEWVAKRKETEKDFEPKYVMFVNYATDNIKADIRRHKGHITKKWLFNILKEESQKEDTNTFSISPRYRVDNGVFYITGFVLYVRYSGITRDLCLNLYDLDYMYKQYEWFLKHELGHFIDHILHHDGITKEELDEREKKKLDDYAKHYKWLDEYRKQPGCNPDTVNRAYYDIPGEAIANELMGINVEDMIKMENAMKKKYKNKMMITTIKLKEARKYTEEEDAHFNGDKKKKKKGESKES
jgi:hypothetical protein